MLPHPRPTLTPTLIKPVTAWSCKWINCFCHSVTHTDQLSWVTQIPQRPSVTNSVHSKLNTVLVSICNDAPEIFVCSFVVLFFRLDSSIIQCSTVLWQSRHGHYYPSSYTEDFFLSEKKKTKQNILAAYIKILTNWLMFQGYFVLELQKCFQKL